MRRSTGQTTKRVQETWDSFWGDLLLRRFHEHNPDRWSAREAKADWLVCELRLDAGASVVDLGCGDGVLDICLAKRGLSVTAIDRMGSVLASAQEEATANGVFVEYIAADLRSHPFSLDSFDGAIFLDVLGLMGREAEVEVLYRLRPALRPGAQVVLDWPRTGTESSWQREFADGLLTVRAGYDEAARVQTIVPEFHHRDGRLIELCDPYCPPPHLGLRRRLYSEAEAMAILTAAGYEGHRGSHYRSEDYHLLLAAPR